MSEAEANVEDNGESGGDKDQKQVAFRKKEKTTADEQRKKIEKLMRNPAVPSVPERLLNKTERPLEAQFPRVPEFIRNVWGSSAGVGSGDFDVYRGIRRREYIRQKIIASEIEKEKEMDEIQKQREAREKVEQEKTAKRRAKRDKKKQRKQRSKQKNVSDKHSTTSDGKQGNEAVEKNASSDSESGSERESESANALQSDASPAKRPRTESATVDACSSSQPVDVIDLKTTTTDSQQTNESQATAPLPVFLRRSAKNAVTIISD